MNETKTEPRPDTQRLALEAIAGIGDHDPESMKELAEHRALAISIARIELEVPGVIAAHPLPGDLAGHILAMADDAYLIGHPEWAAIVAEARGKEREPEWICCECGHVHAGQYLKECPNPECVAVDSLDPTTRGRIATHAETLDRIHREMDGTEWSADTTQEIAQALRDGGYEIREPEDTLQFQVDASHGADDPELRAWLESRPAGWCDALDGPHDIHTVTRTGGGMFVVDSRSFGESGEMDAEQITEEVIRIVEGR